jgi:nucleoside-diphosphate-sugar epimerase
MGGSRFNGYHLVQELVRNGHEVTMFNRGVTETDVPPAVRRLYGDRKDHAVLREVLGKEEFDCVQDTSAYTLDDVESMVEIFRGRTGHYIFASSTVVYARAKVLPITEDYPVDSRPERSEYGRNKILCENYLVAEYRRNGFPASMTRYSMVFGPRNIIPDREQRMFVRLLRDRPVLIPGKGNTLSQVGHVEDEARALRLMMLNPRTFGQIYNLTGKEYWTDEGYVDLFGKVLGLEPRKVHVPDEVMDALGNRPGRPLIQRLALDVHRWDESSVFSIDKLREHAGWEPVYTLEGMIAQTYEWFCNQGLHKTLEFDFSWEDELLARLGA